MEYRVIVKTRALTAGSIMRRLTSMSHRQVGSHLFCLLLIFLFCIFLYFCPDYKTGFGGDYGVQTDRVDKSAVGWEHHEQVDKHESQKGKIEPQKGPLPSLLYVLFSDYKTGFGGQYGVQADRVDKSAVGWDHREQVNTINITSRQ